jgi:ribosomal protein S18 acetylase RimI-like enzyme
VEFVEAEARLQGVRTLHLEVVRKNTGALAFYRSFGFHDHDHMSKKIAGKGSHVSAPGLRRTQSAIESLGSGLF